MEYYTDNHLISATVPAGHQGSVSKEKTGYQLPVADYQLPVADYQLPVADYQLPVADYLSSFKGPHGPVPGLPGITCMKIFDSFFACFSILHLFIFWSQNTPQKAPLV